MRMSTNFACGGLAFSIYHVVEGIPLPELALNEREYQFLVSIREHKAVKWIAIPLDVSNVIDFERCCSVSS